MGYIKEAFRLDVIADTIEKEANLANYFTNIIKYLKANSRTKTDIYNRIRYGLKQWPTYSLDEKRAIVVALKEALSNVNIDKKPIDPEDAPYTKLNTDQWLGRLSEWLVENIT
jgi:hypothetical protein